jgi:uncharacterized delta-60 repeat protein
MSPRPCRAPRVLTILAALAAVDASAQSIDAYDPQPQSPPTTLTIDAAGKIVVAGNFLQIGGITRTRVARLDEDGSVDATFVDPGVDGEVKAVAVQADGKLLIGGGFTHVAGQARHNLARLDADGTLDGGFADPVLDGTVWAIAIAPDGRIVVGGDFTHVGATARNYAARFTTGGAFDGSFADPQLCCLPVRAITLQPDGHVVIGGAFSQAGGVNQHYYLARFTTSGAFDPALPDAPPSVPIVGDALLVVPDGSVFVQGASNRPVIKLHPDGTLDDSFVAAATDGFVDGISAQPDGKIVIAGIFQSVGGQPRHGLARLDADGSLDATFADLQFSFNATDANGYVYGVTVQPDGRIVAVGNFSFVHGTARKYMARATTGDYAGSVFLVQAGSTLGATWFRSGGGAELAEAPLLQRSSDGTTFTTLTTMSRVAGGWHADAAGDVHGPRFYLRALGSSADGGGDGSRGRIAGTVWSSDTIFAWGFE